MAHGWEQLAGRSEVRPRPEGARLKCAARAFPQGVPREERISRFHGTCRGNECIFENHAFRDCAGRAPAVRFQRIELYWEARRGP